MFTSNIIHSDLNNAFDVASHTQHTRTHTHKQMSSSTAFLTPRPSVLAAIPHLLIHSPPHQAKDAYRECMQFLQTYSSMQLTNPASFKKLHVPFEKKKMSLQLRKSDVHVEIDFSVLSCNSKLVWNTLYTFLSRLTNRGNALVVLCHACEHIQPSFLPMLYYYLQDNHALPRTALRRRLTFFFFTSNAAVFPPSIRHCCVPVSFSIPIASPSALPSSSTSASTSPPRLANAPPQPATETAKSNKMKNIMNMFKAHASSNSHSSTATSAATPSPGSTSESVSATAFSLGASLQDGAVGSTGMDVLVSRSAHQLAQCGTALNIGDWLATREHIYHPMVHNANMSDVMFEVLHHAYDSWLHSSHSADGDRDEEKTEDKDDKEDKEKEEKKRTEWLERMEKATLECVQQTRECCRPIFHYEKWLIELGAAHAPNTI